MADPALEYVAIQEKLDDMMDGLGQQSMLRRLSKVLDKDDHVGLSFWLAAGIMLASTAFFFFQVFLVPRRWANSMIVAGLVGFLSCCCFGVELITELIGLVLLGISCC